MGARRLATLALAIWEGWCIEGQERAFHHPIDQPLEDAGQPAAHAVRPRLVSDAAPGLADTWVVAMGMDGICHSNDIDPAVAAFSRGSAPTPKWNLQAESHSRRARRPRARNVTDRAHDHMFGLSGMAYGGCDSAHAGSHVRNSKELAGMGDCGAGQARRGPGNIRNF